MPILERLSVELARTEQVNPAVVTCLNRLSGRFFDAARVANTGGKADVLWVPGANRGGWAYRQVPFPLPRPTPARD